jgi:hypothetical protein
MNKELVSSIYDHSSIPEYVSDGDPDNWYLPSRASVYGVNRLDRLVVLPDAESVSVYAMQFRDIVDELEQAAPNFVMIPDVDYLLDQSIRQNLGTITERLNGNGRYRVHPYSNNIFLRAWVNELNKMGFDINICMPERVYYSNLKDISHRGGWGRWVENEAGRTDESSFPEDWGIPYPTSYIGQGLEQIRQAYRLTTETSGHDSVYFKPIFSGGGFTIRKLDSDEELQGYYSELQSAGGLTLFDKEIPVEIQEEIPDVIGFASLQYYQGRIITPGGLTRQIVDGDNWVGNIFNSQLQGPLGNQHLDIFSRFRQGTLSVNGHNGFVGGLDFAIQRCEGHERLVVLENNGSREVGANPAIALADSFDVSDKPFLIRKVSNPRCDLRTFWEMLKLEGMQYDPQTKGGVFPALIIKGNGFLFVAGESEQEILEMTDKASELAYNNGYIK